MKKLYFAAALGLVSVATLMAAKGEKVQIWHLNDDGGYTVIYVSPNAVDAHLAHGDSLDNPDCD